MFIILRLIAISKNEVIVICINTHCIAYALPFNNKVLLSSRHGRMCIAHAIVERIASQQAVLQKYFFSYIIFTRHPIYEPD